MPGWRGSDSAGRQPTDGAIRAVGSRGQPSTIVTTSIEVYRLARRDLSRLRKTWVLRVRNQVAFCELARRTGTAAEREIGYQGGLPGPEPAVPRVGPADPAGERRETGEATQRKKG